MITALRTAVWNEGFKPASGEHELLLAVAALALTETGPGAPSLDSALEVERSGPGWVLAALGAGAGWLGDGNLNGAPARGARPGRAG
jgi:putative oxidoreductase